MAFALQRNGDRPLASRAWSNVDALDFVQGDAIGGAVIQLGRPRRFVRRDDLGVLDRASVLKVRGDARRTERVTADSAGVNPRRLRTALNHSEGVSPTHPV